MRIACIQLNSSDRLQENLASTERLVREAAKNDAKLVLLPENYTLMPQSERERRETIETFGDGIIQRQAIDLAKELGIWFIGGSTPITMVEGQSKPYATQFVASPAGKIVAAYNKIHLFDVETPNGEKYDESDIFAAGSSPKWVDINGIRFGLTICYDVRFPELYRQLIDESCQVFTVPAAFTQVTGEAHWHVLLRSRAIENQCYVLAAAQWGTHANGRKTYGHSLIIDPWGDIVDEVESGIGICYADIDPSFQQRIRRQMPVLQHRRITAKPE